MDTVNTHTHQWKPFPYIVLVLGILAPQMPVHLQALQIFKINTIYFASSITDKTSKTFSYIHSRYIHSSSINCILKAER